jgi:hypothetical protein
VAPVSNQPEIGSSKGIMKKSILILLTGLAVMAVVLAVQVQ